MMAETNFKYDVFFSYNSKDKPAVENIARLLRDEYKLKVWLDTWNLVPGEVVQKELENALDSCQTFAVFVGESGIGPWENDEMRAAIGKRVKDSKRRAIPVLLPKAPDNKNLKLPSFLELTLWVDFRSGLDDKDALYRLCCGITGQAPGDQTFTPSNVQPETWFLKHPYPMPPNFTGRVAERADLTHWLNEDSENRLLVIRALGGFGKSALTWHWLTHDVDPQAWSKVVFWSFYEGDASFENFVRETLEYLAVGQDGILSHNTRQQVDELLRALQSQNILLIMDGFERALRAYSSMNAAYMGDDGQWKMDESAFDCVNVDAEIFLKGVCSHPHIKGKALMTTRLTPRAVQPRGEMLAGCREIELSAMQKADAVEFFRRQGIRGTHAEVEAACEPYGYHPLSLRLLAGRIMKDLRNAGDIAVAQTIQIDGDLKQRQNHILKVAYESLPRRQQNLLGQIACFRAPVDMDTLTAICKPYKPKGFWGFFKKALTFYVGKLDADLQDLIERGLLHVSHRSPITNHHLPLTFDLHPIVRRYAYDRLTAPERTNSHGILIIYFEAVPEPQKVQTLEDLAPVIELYHHTVRAGKLDEALDMFDKRLVRPIYFQFGAYQLCIELLRALFPDGEEKPPRLKNESAQAWTLNTLANAYALNGQSRRAVPLLEMHNAIYEKAGDKKNLAIGLGNVADDQLKIGALSDAERNLRRRIDLCREIADETNEPDGHRDLGRLLSYKGSWDLSAQELELSWNQSEKQHHVQRQSTIAAYQSLRFLLMARANPKSSIENRKSAIEAAQRALELADEFSCTDFRVERDYVRAYWLLGSAYRANNDLTLAEENLSKALNLCRQINMVDHEADILLDVARLRYAQGDFKDALAKAAEALVIAERCGYVLQGADVHLFLAEMAMDRRLEIGDWKMVARRYAEEALRLATCDGGEYKYKVAYEEAERLLEKLRESK